MRDVVIESLGRHRWDAKPVLVTVSLGYAGRRLFFYAASADTFLVTDFRKVIEPWLTREQSEPKEPFPREGIGCWHPVFPARADDVWLMAATAVKCVEGTFGGRTGLRVFQQPPDGSLGVHEIASDPS
jgi:hypothetical protein